MGQETTDSPGKGTDDAAGSPSSVQCSICLDEVTDDGERSTAKLKCGHRFHLDCIGSAFNAKGLMQCPNCRENLEGKWVYGPEPRLQTVDSPSSVEPSIYDRIHNLFSRLNTEDLYYMNYRGMVYGLPSNLYNREEHGSVLESGHAGRDFSTPSNESSQVANSQISSSSPHLITADLEQAISNAPQSSSSLASSGLESTLSEHAVAFYPSPSTERIDRDFEFSGDRCFYAWERDQFAPFPLLPVDGNLSWGGPTSQIFSRTGTSHPTRCARPT